MKPGPISSEVMRKLFTPVLARLKQEGVSAEAAASALWPAKQTKAMREARRWFAGYRDGLKRALLLIKEEMKRK